MKKICIICTALDNETVEQRLKRKNLTTNVEDKEILKVVYHLTRTSRGYLCQFCKNTEMKEK